MVVDADNKGTGIIFQRGFSNWVYFHRCGTQRARTWDVLLVKILDAGYFRRKYPRIFVQTSNRREMEFFGNVEWRHQDMK